MGAEVAEADMMAEAKIEMEAEESLGDSRTDGRGRKGAVVLFEPVDGSAGGRTKRTEVQLLIIESLTVTGASQT